MQKVNPVKPELIDLDKSRNTVSEFSNEMKQKLIQKHFQGFRGWDSMPLKEITDALVSHVMNLGRDYKPEDAIDIANFAMFLWYNLKEADNVIS